MSWSCDLHKCFCPSSHRALPLTRVYTPSLTVAHILPFSLFASLKSSLQLCSLFSLLIETRRLEQNWSGAGEAVYPMCQQELDFPGGL